MHCMGCNMRYALCTLHNSKCMMRSEWSKREDVHISLLMFCTASPWTGIPSRTQACYSVFKPSCMHGHVHFCAACTYVRTFQCDTCCAQGAESVGEQDFDMFGMCNLYPARLHVHIDLFLPTWPQQFSKDVDYPIELADMV